jgi:MraZ protein
VADRAAYQGDGLGLVDDKGRVAIPSSLRTILAGNSPRDDGKDGGTVIIGVHQKHPCLVAYDPAYVVILKSQLDQREASFTSEDGEFNYNIKRRAAQGEAVPFDGSGRFIMPGFPRFHAGIGANAFFYGVFDYFEIWDPKTLLETEGVPDMMKSCARYHCAQKGIAL